MSRVVVNEIQAKVGNDVKFNSNIANPTTVKGEGSNTTNLQQGLCKQWVHFNGTGTSAGATITAVDSFNTSSLLDNNTGDYQVSIANNMNNVGYSVSGTIAFEATGTNSLPRQGPAVNEHATSTYQVYAGSNTTSLGDSEVVNTQTMGDLA